MTTFFRAHQSFNIFQLSMLRRLYIVRHAERKDNLIGSSEGKRLYGDNSPLSDRGLSQSEDLRN